ncbi:hypothetical protein ZWY2020_044128 [Hordeum vulgare]|nr:hypothetical protein ZWY2020_044128 [Hordeum vulgare]
MENLRPRPPNPRSGRGGTEAPAADDGEAPLDRRTGDVVGAFRRVARGLPAGDIPWEASPSRRRATATPGPSRRRASAPSVIAPPASPEVTLPLEQAALHHDGDPDDTHRLAVCWRDRGGQQVGGGLDERSDGGGGSGSRATLEAATEEDD